MAESSPPARTLSVADAIFVTVGIVVGAGIFKAPSLVAANSSSDLTMLLMWVAGGCVALIGALCYAELASTYPSTGGDYSYLRRAFGRGPAFLFGWARLAIMQTGSIALLGFVFGDYASQIISLGTQSSAIYAALAVVIFTVVNLVGIREGKGTQRAFTSLEILGLTAVIIFGLALGGHALLEPIVDTGQQLAASTSSANLGLAMVFVLLTFGGWNEAAYVSGEMRGHRSAIARALIISIALITTLYLLINVAYLKVLGHAGMAASDAVAADALRIILGENGSRLISVIVAVSALTSINATIITGARCNHALGGDVPALSFLSRWNAATGTPSNALITQAVVALLLVALGAATRSGFSTLVEYTAPVFWFFFLMTGVALFRLRVKDPQVDRPFRVPLYPLIPALFCISSAYMLWSSVTYTGMGAWVGVAVLLAGVPFLFFMQLRSTNQSSINLRGGSIDEHPEAVTRLARGRNIID